LYVWSLVSLTHHTIETRHEWNATHDVLGRPHDVGFVDAQDGVDEEPIVDGLLDPGHDLAGGVDVAVGVPVQLGDAIVHLDALGRQGEAHLVKALADVADAGLGDELDETSAVGDPGRAGVAEVSVDADAVGEDLGRLGLLYERLGAERARDYQSQQHHDNKERRERVRSGHAGGVA
jgi:hypothetical protein